MRSHLRGGIGEVLREKKRKSRKTPPKTTYLPGAERDATPARER
jgi:hypothetical protein